MSCADLDYLRECLEVAPFVPHSWDGEDRNIGAFRSKEELVAWYCQPPGIDGQPYRDRGFYTRELAMLSRLVQPRCVVEFGTCQGIGTCLLRWLNPTARLVTVDLDGAETFLPDRRPVPVGYLSKWNGVECEYVSGYSWDYHCDGVGLCFIDADHSYASVLKDSVTAWCNRAQPNWAIAWHDHNNRHPGVVDAVNKFCTDMSQKLCRRLDSDTVWIMGEA